MRLVAALRHVLGTGSPAPARPPEPPLQARFGESVLAPRDAFFAAHDVVALADATGRVSADSIAAYPPGIPNVLPGERFTGPVVDYLLEMHLRGCPLRGTWDARAATVRVVRRP